MQGAFQLEEFKETLWEPGGSGAPRQTMSSSEAENMRALSYDEGYKAGWDDAVEAELTNQTRISTEFGKSLQDIGFTFHEARVNVMHSLEPFIRELLGKLMPKFISETFGQKISEELMALARDASDAPLELVISPQNRVSVEPLLDAEFSEKITLVEEETLADGQAILRGGQLERRVDLTEALQHIIDAFNSVQDINEKAVVNG